MAGKASGKYDVPDFKDAPIEVLIADLRKGIASDCSVLLMKARRVYADHHGFNLKSWEARVCKVREAQVATYSIEELESLRKECKEMSAQLDSFAR
jgi:hypothetical protein